MSATAIGSSILEFLISYYHDIFQTMNQEYSLKYTKLHHKCYTLKKLYIKLQDIVEANYAQYLGGEKEVLIIDLWSLLEEAEQFILSKLS